MRVFMEQTTGRFEEVFNFDIGKIANQDLPIATQDLQKTLEVLLSLSLSTEDGYEYFARVYTSAEIEIRYTRDKKFFDHFPSDKKQMMETDGIIASFSYLLIEPKYIRTFVKEELVKNWTSLAETAIKEISNLHLAALNYALRD